MQENEEWELRELVWYLGTHGGMLQVARKDGVERSDFEHVPVSLRPTRISAVAFGLAKSASIAFTELAEAVSRNPAYLREKLSGTARGDPFTARLLQLMDLSEHSRAKAPRPELVLVRNDFMLQEAAEAGQPPVPKLIEMNTISASLSTLSAVVREAHAYLHARLGRPTLLPEEWEPAISSNGLADALAAAADAYTPCVDDRCEPPAPAKEKPVVLMLVQPHELNVLDQFGIIERLQTHHHRVCLRKTLQDLARDGRLRENDRSLWLGSSEVAVVYFRTAYDPSQYTESGAWEARELVEQARCVAVPSVQQQLAGCKKIQQVLAMPGELEAFLPDDSARHVRTALVEHYPLDASSAADEGRKRLAASPERYVLKPQREGGGHNTYGEQIPAALMAMSAEEQDAHILMERIMPPPVHATFVKHGVALCTDAIVELGLYGMRLRTCEGALSSEAYLGSLLRTKPKDANEGGLIAGFSVLDSPLLSL